MPTPKTDATGKIQPASAAGAGEKLAARLTTLSDVLNRDNMRREIARALPKHLAPDRMVRIAMTALRTTRNLASCTADSFLACVLQASQLGLEVNTPLQHAFLIPRRNKEASKRSGRDVFECTLQIGYQGMIELCRNSGLVESVRARAVREGDFFEYVEGLDPMLAHRRGTAANREQAPITYAYAVARLKGGGREFEVLSRAQIEDRRRRSASASSERTSPWDTDYEAMACKSAVRALYRWLPKSAEMAQGESLEVAADQSRPQAYDASVHESLAALGMQSPDNDNADEPDEDSGNGVDVDRNDDGVVDTVIDPETGEVLDGQGPPS